jgi:hypothetical protein
MNRGFIGALCLGVTFSLLAGCGGSQPPIGAPGAMPQTSAIAQTIEHRTLGSGGALLYVTSTDKVDFYTLPGLQAEGSITINNPWAICSDTSGDVFISNDTGKLFEYAYGSTDLLEELDTKTNAPVTGCSVDATTGNIAAAAGDVLVLSGRRHKKIVFYSDLPFFATNCAYDATGNLFAVGNQLQSGHNFGLSELSKGASDFQAISVNALGTATTAVQWDGKYLALNVALRGHKRVIYRIGVNGSVGTVAQTVSVKNFGPGPFWIENGTLYGTTRTSRNEIGLWAYPRGGQPASGPVVQGATYVTVAIQARRVAQAVR